VERSEFDAWFTDFGLRYPAVAEYLKKRPEEDRPVLLDTWHKTLLPYPLDVCQEVTWSIISGKLDPVANVDLGQFGDQVRRRCREVMETRRQADRRKSKAEDPPAAPLVDGNMPSMLRHLKAAEALMTELGQDATIEERVTPWHWSGAAIILADDHTAGEAADALATLEAAGLDWPTVQCRAAEIHEVTLWEEVPSE
jgi:hypothetical protein